MKTEELIALGLTDEQAAKVFAMNGKDVTAEKAKFADYGDIKEQLKTANDTIGSFGDVEAIRADVVKYKLEAEAAKTTAEKRIAQMETQAKVKEFTSSKQFVNVLTKEAIERKLLKELDNEGSKGKSFDDIFKGITEGQENLLADPNKPEPPVQAAFADGVQTKTAESTLRSATRAYEGYVRI